MEVTNFESLVTSLFWIRNTQASRGWRNWVHGRRHPAVVITLRCSFVSHLVDMELPNNPRLDPRRYERYGREIRE